MGLRKWLADKLNPPAPEEPTKEMKPGDEITGYELYEAPPRGKWNKILDIAQEVDFADLEDAKPGLTYKLCSRHKSGHMRTIWHQAVPGEVKTEIVNPLAQVREILGPLKEVGAEIQGLQEDIKGAFGWAFPTPSPGGVAIGAPDYRGDLPVYMHPAVPQTLMAWSPVLREWTKDITAGIKEGITGVTAKAEERPGAKVEFSRPPPDAAAFLARDEEEREEA